MHRSILTLALVALFAVASASDVVDVRPALHFRAACTPPRRQAAPPALPTSPAPAPSSWRPELTATPFPRPAQLNTGRKLLASCSIGGKKFTSCQKVKGGTVGFAKSGSTVSVGFLGGSSSGWAGWTVGQPHQGSSAVFNIGGSVSTRTMNGKLAVLIRPPSKVKFGGVKGGKAGSKLYATFTMQSSGPFRWAFAYGPGNLIQHAGIPKTYTF